MPLRLLLDENVELGVEKALKQAGHDVVHVQDVESLGKQSYDHEIAAYSKRTGRYVLTNDDDFYREIDDELPTLFFFPNQRISAHRLTSVIGAIEEQFTGEEIDQQPVIKVVEDWL